MRPEPLIIGLLLVTLASAAGARQPPPSPIRFPMRFSEALVRELADVGRVSSRREAGDPDSWKRWGRAVPERQDAALRAVLDALADSRPSLDVSAAILAIARVESGFNPDSENPGSTACGIFQFIRATWEAYSSTRETCFDPTTNAEAGVRHLTTLHGLYVQHALPPLRVLPDEMQRVEHTYRLLYAYHYHGSGSAFAPLGGSVEAQLAAEGGLAHLRRFFSILKRAVYVPPRVRRHPGVRAAARRKAPRAVQSTRSKGRQARTT